MDQILAAEEVTSLASPGEVLYPLTDHLGTTRDLAEYDVVEEETTVVSHRVFDSFGVLISETSSAITILIGFTGRPLDESTGLQNNWNRWYAESVVTIRVPAGTMIFEGAAAPQSTGVGQLLGGGNQVYIPRVDPNWIVP